ncbi:MAG: pyruvate carboxyltransferase, partial [Thermodesulfobacteriota bacterium]
MKKKYGVIDSTLREGEQTPGVKISDHARRNILSRLYKIGVDEIEMGIASPLNSHIPGLVDAARHITGGDCRLALWSRCVRRDISFAGSCKPDVLSLSIPASDLHITKRLRRDRVWVLRKLSSSIAQAVRCDIPYISVGFEDSSRADPEFLVQLGKVAEESGARRIRLADTVGVCTPASIGRLVRG